MRVFRHCSVLAAALVICGPNARAIEPRVAATSAAPAPPTAAFAEEPAEARPEGAPPESAPPESAAPVVAEPAEPAAPAAETATSAPAPSEPLPIAVTYAAPPVIAPSSSMSGDDATGASAAAVRFSDRAFTLYVGGGFGTIVGNGGALLSLMSERVGVVGGVGWSPWGMQWGVAARGRLKLWERSRFAHAFIVSPGFTTGPWKEWADYVVPARTVNGENEYEVRHIDRAYWAQLDFAYELRTRSGLSVTVGPGMSMLVNPGDCQGDEKSCEDAGLMKVFPLRGTFSVFAGYAF